MFLRIFVLDSLCEPITNSRRCNVGRHQDCYYQLVSSAAAWNRVSDAGARHQSME